MEGETPPFWEWGAGNKTGCIGRHYSVITTAAAMAPIRTSFITPKRRPANDTPKPLQPVKQSESFDHHEGILRSSFRINDSGSKVLSVYLDPAADFEVTVHIGKPGGGGLKLTHRQFQELVCLDSKAAEFFQSTAEKAEVVTEHGVRVRFSRGWVTPVMKIAVNCADVDQAASYIVIVEGTFQHLTHYTCLYEAACTQLETDRSVVKMIYNDMVGIVRGMGVSQQPSPQVVEQRLNATNDTPWLIKDGQYTKMMQTRIYYEITTMCTEKISNELRM